MVFRRAEQVEIAGEIGEWPFRPKGHVRVDHEDELRPRARETQQFAPVVSKIPPMPATVFPWHSGQDFAHEVFGVRVGAHVDDHPIVNEPNE